MTTLITLTALTALTGAAAYVSALTCGRWFAIPFALLAAAAVPVIAFR